MKLEEVIKLLADGEMHSGEELGELLGVSRTAVWKQLQKLESYGLQLNVEKGKGYQLLNGLELLDASVILNGLDAKAKKYLSNFEVLGSVDSTNRLTMERAQSGNGHGYVCVAEHQSSGKGRLGRSWVSPYGRNIYLSAGWEFSGGVTQLEGLSLAVGVAIVRALRDCDIHDVKLKWPNDVLWQQKKLAGVLMEMSGDPSGNCQVVIGIGLNVAMMENEAQTIEQPWTSVSSITENYSRNQLLISMLNHLLELLSGYADRGFESYRVDWESADGFQNRDVEVRIGENILTGRAAGVVASGALRLITADGEQLIHGGEASLRRAN